MNRHKAQVAVRLIRQAYCHCETPGPGVSRPARWLRGVTGAVWLVATAVAAMAQDCADLDLVLAIDGSGSIDSAEFSLQQQGYAAAFRRPDVQDALGAAGTVDVAVIFWGDSEIAVQVLPWTRLDGPRSAEMLAANLEGTFRHVQGNTGLGRALWLSLDLLALPGQCGRRKVINVSGDGYESFAPRSPNHIPLSAARTRATAQDVVVNALAIENEVPDLSGWYQNHLLVGPGAFVMRAARFEDFAEAIARKLIREIQAPGMALRPAPSADHKT
jgi:Protein of unknown function (DUF1194)